MASEFHFGVAHNWGRTPGVERDRMQEIAERHGCGWTEIWDVASGSWKSWFSKKNEGSPFDERAESAVMKEVLEVSDDPSDR